MRLSSRETIASRLRRSKNARTQFVESHLAKTIAYQIRATRDRLGWSQERLAREVGMNQNAISRLESPEYGKPTLTTLKRLASALDVGLVVRFVPFSELVDWITVTPRVIKGLSTESLAVPGFDEEDEARAFDGENAAVQAAFPAIAAWSGGRQSTGDAYLFLGIAKSRPSMQLLQKNANARDAARQVIPTSVLQGRPRSFGAAFAHGYAELHGPGKDPVTQVIQAANFNQVTSHV